MKMLDFILLAWNSRVVPGIDKHIEPMILVIIALSLLPALITWYRERKKGATAPRAVHDP